jgi:hypothetical protein
MKQAALALLLVLSVVITGEMIAFPFFFRDDQQAHFLPGFADIARAWLAGEAPWVSPYSWCAGGLLGEYQFGLFNPVVQLAVVASSFVPDLAVRDAALVAFFAWIMAWGALRLAQDYKLDRNFGLALAAVFCFNRFALDVGWRSWLPMAIGATWIPWVWHDCVRSRLSVPKLTLSLFLVLTAGWPFAVVATATLGVFYFLLALYRKQWRRAGQLVLAALCALALASPALASLVEHSRSAIRANSNRWEYRLEALDGLPYIVPGLVSHSQGMELANLFTDIGWIPCLGLLAAARRPRRDPLWALALFWFALGLAPSMGGMRFSFRWLNYLNPLMGLLGLVWLQRHAKDENHRFGRETWGLLLVGQVLGPILDGLRGLPHRWEVGPILLLAGFCLAWNARPKLRSPLVLLATMVGLCLAVPLTALSGHGFPMTPTPADTPVRNDRVWMSLYTWDELQDPRAELVVPTRYGNASMVEAVEFVNGYSPLFVAPLIRAWTFSNVGSLDTSERARVNVALGSIPGGLMDKLGITGLLLSPQWSGLGQILAQNGWTHAGAEGLIQIWTRGQGKKACFESLPRAVFREKWPAAVEQALEPDGVSVVHAGPDAAKTYATVELSQEENGRNSAKVRLSAAAQPALIAIHRAYLVGYRADLDGRPLIVQNLNLQQMAVEIPAGSPAGTLTVRYQPAIFDYAPYLMALGLLGALAAQKIRPAEGEHEGDPEQGRTGRQTDESGTVAQVHVEDGHQKGLDAGNDQAQDGAPDA